MNHNTTWDLEISMVIPYGSLVEYPNDFEDVYHENVIFKRIRETLKIQIDIEKLHEEIENMARKDSSILVYYSNMNFENFIVFDTHIGLTDQLDLIDIGIRCEPKYSGLIRSYAHEFYVATCKYNIHYCEGNNNIKNRFKEDFSKYHEIMSSNYIHSNLNRRLCFYQGGNRLNTINT